MNHSFQTVVKNCGNFSSKVLPGLIAYGREAERERIKSTNSKLSNSDGYATREHDIKLGGFLYWKSAQEAKSQGKTLSQLGVQETQQIALKVAKDHIEKFGEVGLENYDHWLKRVRNYSKYHHMELPSKFENEGEYQYSRRLRDWTLDQPEKWPVMQKSVGTHLVFSPDPKMWEEIRKAGYDEREFLKWAITKTMKELHDWRRQHYGPGHSLGWVAGTHVRDNDANRHPHIHVVVLKRDECGKEVDWSVSALKGRHSRKNEPDQLRTVKQYFHKNVEKQYELILKHSVPRDTSKIYDVPQRVLNPFIVKKIRSLTRSVLPVPHKNPESELSALIRLFRMYRSQIRHGNHQVQENLPTFVDFKKWVATKFPKTKEQSIQPGE